MAEGPEWLTPRVCDNLSEKKLALALDQNWRFLRGAGACAPEWVPVPGMLLSPFLFFSSPFFSFILMLLYLSLYSLLSRPPANLLLPSH